MGDVHHNTDRVWGLFPEAVTSAWPCRVNVESHLKASLREVSQPRVMQNTVEVLYRNNKTNDFRQSLGESIKR